MAHLPNLRLEETGNAALRDLYRQFGVNAAQARDKRTVDNFRTDCLRELKKIKEAWPGLNYEVARGVLIIAPSTPAILPVTH